MKENHKRLYLLDLARAIAATCVVLHHYQHFYLGTDYQGDAFNKTHQPFYQILEPFYEFGSVAVQFFFVLSGFIFFMFYRKKIFEKTINFKNFFILRISRLYPLHLLTLIIVLILQQIFYSNFSEYFIYKQNDLSRFISHLFLFQEWGLVEGTSSFNAPSWSISVEIFLYITFFVVSIFFIKNLFQSFITVILTTVIYIFLQPSLGTLILGLLLFYVGGFTFFLYVFIKNFEKKNYLIFLIILVNIIVFGKFLSQFFLTQQNSIDYLIGNKLNLLLYYIKFPLIIINLSLIQLFKNDIGKNIQVFGDISYTIYLVHFPVQLVFALINKKIFEINFDENYFFITYFLSVFLISFLIYKFYELPTKKIIRKRLL